MSDIVQEPVVVIGAGPVGLAAAAHLAERGLDFVVLEAGRGPGAAVAEWGHVRLFSPWRHDIDSAARRLLEAEGWQSPDLDELPTGAELVTRYLEPLARTRALAGRVRYGAVVAAITRDGFDRVRSAGREHAPFLIRLADGSELTARAVIDASGTWRTPNVLGATGIPALGEAEAGDAVFHALPDVLGADRAAFAGRRTVVAGSGHSAATTLLGLVQLADEAPGTEVVWTVRGGAARGLSGDAASDPLPARGAIGERLRELVEQGRIELLSGFGIRAVRRQAGGRLELHDGTWTVLADVVVNATGFRPDHAIAGELRLDLDPILGSTRALADLIDPNVHHCGTVPPHGVEQLTHPEPGYFVLGMKAYGRAPTFLMATGYEQARSVVAALAGDWEAARRVEFVLPAEGACGVAVAAELTGQELPVAAAAGGCC